MTDLISRSEEQYLINSEELFNRVQKLKHYEVRRNLFDEIGIYEVFKCQDVLDAILASDRIDAVPVVPRGYISINLLKSKLDNEFGDNWIFDHSEPKTIEGCDSWLRRSMMRALWIWMCNTEAAQHGEKLAGKWVNNSSGVLACSVCGIPKKYACMEDGSCASCGAKMDGESEEDTNGHQTD